ncbi:MAG: hypothetical protein UT84_C0002G0079 [Candidatus Curtissbacteria bacterium GW2011_GWA1_40_16]|uniref:Uncharacterized protein n=1 Tax=Candidatus Curtissbacteria bacterium GW2011_GWA1_40_16 TaxID=1618405 RepID=A0A0G0RFK7_9BACT|nr:MAG: hypothetical protein UT84_C0002G0079 [Candidatus Curtissbacteria bacterium GW2011_GWA1_40_16]
MKKGFATVLLVFIVTLLLLGGIAFSVFVLNNNFQKPRPPEGIDYVDETANWKTYNAADFVTTQNPSLYHFSVKYPPDWQSKAFLYFMSPDYKAPMSAQETVFKGAFIQMTASQAYTQSFPTLMDWFNNSFKDPRSSGPPPDNPTPITLNIGSLGKVDGLQYDQKISIQAPDSVFKYSADLVGTSLTKLFVHNNVMYYFILTYKDDPIKYMPVLDQMISTFKLTQ